MALVGLVFGMFAAFAAAVTIFCGLILTKRRFECILLTMRSGSGPNRVGGFWIVSDWSGPKGKLQVPFGGPKRGFASETPVFAIFMQNRGQIGREGFAETAGIFSVMNSRAFLADVGFAFSAGIRNAEPRASRSIS